MEGAPGAFLAVIQPMQAGLPLLRRTEGECSGGAIDQRGQQPRPAARIGLGMLALPLRIPHPGGKPGNVSLHDVRSSPAQSDSSTYFIFHSTTIFFPTYTTTFPTQSITSLSVISFLLADSNLRNTLYCVS